MVSETYTWNCNRCGECCTKTIADTGLGRYGVFLLPHERFLFPEQYVKPLYGVGIKGKSRPRPKYIYAYQNISEPCGWYEPKLRECMIYDKRPLACREFPLSEHGGGIMLHRECPQVAKLIPEGVTFKPNQLKGFTCELEALKEMVFYFFGLFVTNIPKIDLQCAWAYDLNKDTWVRWTLQELEEFLGVVDKKVKQI